MTGTDSQRIDEAIARMIASFPFSGYCDDLIDAYRNVANTVLRHARAGSTILDFGSGPCDKAAVLQTLGFICTATDDLSDDWHNIDGNRERIETFARGAGIDFHVNKDGKLPYRPASFDMVMLHDVIEHLHESPRDLLNDLTTLIKPGGHLFITVPNAGNARKRLALLAGGTNYPDFECFYWLPAPWRGHVREYVRADLEKVVRFAGLQEVELFGCDHMLNRLPRPLRRPFKVITNVLPGLKDTWALVARKPPEWKPAAMLSGQQAQAIADRLRPYRQAP